MFKPIPGNDEYSINFDGVIRNCRGVIIPIVNSKLTLIFFGKQKTYSIDWLKYVAYFEIHFQNIDNYNHLGFVEIQTVSREGINVLPITDRPVYYLDKFRVILNFSRYAISEGGEVIRLSDNKIIPIEKHRLNGYPVISLYNPERGEKTNLVLHRLIALTWIRNDDIVTKCNVNHIDGNKENYSVANLEWSTPSENSLHAVNNGLRNDNVPIEIMDVDTLDEYTFPSIHQACAFVGCSPKAYTDLPKHKLLNDKYKYRLVGGSVWYPDLATTRNTSSVEVSGFNHLTREVIVAESIKAMARRTGIWYNTIITSLKSDPEGQFYGKDSWSFCYGIREVWDGVYSPSPTVQISVVAKNGDEVLTFKSLRSVSEYFNVDRSTVKNRLNTGNELKGYKLTSTAHH